MGSAILAGGVWAANIVISATFLTIMEHVGAAGAFGIYAGICAVSISWLGSIKMRVRVAHHLVHFASSDSYSFTSSTSKSADFRLKK